jgi:hypothetical protein
MLRRVEVRFACTEADNVFALAFASMARVREGDNDAARLDIL